MDPTESALKALQDLAGRDSAQIGPHFATLMKAVEPIDGDLASGMFRRLSAWIQQFESALDPEHEVGVRLASFGQSILVHLQDIRYWNPALISFRGVTDDGQPAELIQHISQVSILLAVVPRLPSPEPRKPIGFHSEPPTGTQP